MLLWGSFAWGLPAEAPAGEGGAEVTAAEDTWRCGSCGAENVAAAKYCTECGAKRADKADIVAEDPWAGVMISGAYDYAKCPECGHKNEIRAVSCSRCGSELPQPSAEFTYPPWVFVPGKGYYPEGTLVDRPKARVGLWITGLVLTVSGAALLPLSGYFGYFGIVTFIAGLIATPVGIVLLIRGLVSRTDPVYACNSGGLNGPYEGLPYARRSPDSDGGAIKVEVTALGF